jgi:hypothetical protein
MLLFGNLLDFSFSQNLPTYFGSSMLSIATYDFLAICTDLIIACFTALGFLDD